MGFGRVSGMSCLSDCKFSSFLGLSMAGRISETSELDSDRGVTTSMVMLLVPVGFGSTDVVVGVGVASRINRTVVYSHVEDRVGARKSTGVGVIVGVDIMMVKCVTVECTEVEYRVEARVRAGPAELDVTVEGC